MSSNFSGHHHTAEARAKNAAAHRGKKQSAETIAKRSAAMRGRVVSAETRAKIADGHRGKPRPDMAGNTFNWRGGRAVNSRNRVLVYAPNHPSSQSGGHVFEHRLVIESALGRFLLPSEEVHHINGNPKDNRRENLALCNNHDSHMAAHRGEIYLPV